MASLRQLYQELNRLRGRKRANPRAIMAAATQNAQTENERRWTAERRTKEDYWARREQEKMARMIEREQSGIEMERLRKEDLERREKDTKEEKERKAKERGEDYQAAIYGIEAGVPELANRFMSKYGPKDVNPTFTYDPKTKQFKLSHPGRELGAMDMEQVGGKWQMKEGTLLKPDQAKGLLEKFQSVESYRDSQKRKTAAAKERRAETKTAIEVGEYVRKGQLGISDKERVKMFGFYVKDRAGGSIDPDVSFDDYLAEAGIGGTRGPGVGIPTEQQVTP